MEPFMAREGDVVRGQLRQLQCLIPSNSGGSRTRKQKNGGDRSGVPILT